MEKSRVGQERRIRPAGADVKKKGRGKRPVPSFIYREAERLFEGKKNVK